MGCGQRSDGPRRSGQHGAVVAALIGAGGFGALVFQGLSSSALDLVLLGVVPVVAMAVLADAALAVGTAVFTVNVTDAAGSNLKQSCSLTINAAPTIGSLTVTQWTTGLAGFAGLSTISGGTAPFSIAGATGLPAGLTATLTGNTIGLTGKPTTAATYAASVTIDDAAGAFLWLLQAWKKLRENQAILSPADRAGFEADYRLRLGMAMRRLPRTVGHLNRHGERVVPLRRLVGIREVVDHLLEPHRVGWRELAQGQVLADDRIAGRIDVDAEGRQRVQALNAGEWVLDELGMSTGDRSIVVRSALITRLLL